MPKLIKSATFSAEVEYWSNQNKLPKYLPPKEETGAEKLLREVAEQRNKDE